MAQSQIFDIVLIGLAVVILCHLFYNNSLFDTNRNTKNEQEQMQNIAFPSINDIYEDVLCKISTDKYRDDADQVSRDNGPLHQTDLEDTPYYHILNQIVPNNSVNSDNDYNSLEDKLDTQVKESNTKECNLQSDADNGYNRFCNSDPTKLETLGRREKRNRSGSYKNYVDENKLFFADNYEGRLTSDPFDADAVQVNRSGLDMKGFLGNNPFEEFKDVKGNKCNLDPESEMLKRYIREYVLDGKDQCYCATDKSKSEFTRDEIDRFREQQIEFGDKINGTSSIPYDAVDKMNDITMNGIKANKQSIADFYDSIVENVYDRKGVTKPSNQVGNLDGVGFIMGTTIPKTDCITPPEFDLNSAIPSGSYTQSANSGGRYFLRDNWRYTNENPNNGGQDAMGVTGSDPFLDSNLIIS